MDHLRLQSAFKFVAVSRFGDGGQLMTAANLCLEAVLPCYQLSPATNYRHQKIKHSYFSNGHIF